MSTPEMLSALPARSAVHPCPAAQLGRRPGPGPCQPPGSAHGLQSWKPTAGEESRGLGPRDGRPGVTGELGLPWPLKYREPRRHGVGVAVGAQCPYGHPSLLPRCSAPSGGVGQEEPPGHSLGKAFSEQPSRLVWVISWKSLTLSPLQLAYFISGFSYRTSWLFYESTQTLLKGKKNTE